MYIVSIAGFMLLLAALAVYRRAWRTVRPQEWAQAFRGTERRFPFGQILRAEARRERLSAWRNATPEWLADDVPARRLFVQIRFSQIGVAVGVACWCFP